MGSPDVELRSPVHTVQCLSVLLGPTKAYIGRSNIQIRDMSMINRHFQPHPVWSSHKSPWCGGLIAALLAAPALTRAGQVTVTAATVRSSGLGDWERSGVEACKH